MDLFVELISVEFGRLGEEAGAGVLEKTGNAGRSIRTVWAMPDLLGRP